MTSSHFELIVPVLRALEPMPAGAVVCGAWTVALYRQYLRVSQELTQTIDLDIALDAANASWRDQDEWLSGVASALFPLGFRSERRGVEYLGAHGDESFVVLRHVPTTHPVSQRLPTIEVIADPGGGGKRPPKLRYSCATLRPQSVGKLCLLFVEPWSINLDVSARVETISIPNPLSFVLQKALIRTGRTRLHGKAETDVASIVEVATLFCERRNVIEGLASRVTAASPRARRHLGEGLDIIRDTLLASGSRVLTNPMIQRTCTPGAAADRIRSFLSACGVAPQ